MGPGAPCAAAVPEVWGAGGGAAPVLLEVRRVSRGIQRERDLVLRLRGEGWWAMRSPASKGAVDVVALRPGVAPRFFEVKATAAGPYAGFLPADRAALLEEAEDAGASAWLVWWPYDRQGPRFIPADAWPNQRGR